MDSGKEDYAMEMDTWSGSIMLATRVTGNTIKLVARASSSILMEISTMVAG